MNIEKYEFSHFVSTEKIRAFLSDLIACKNNRIKKQQYFSGRLIIQHILILCFLISLNNHFILVNIHDQQNKVIIWQIRR